MTKKILIKKIITSLCDYIFPVFNRTNGSSDFHLTPDMPWKIFLKYCMKSSFF